jgi:hypothetical protein
MTTYRRRSKRLMWRLYVRMCRWLAWKVERVLNRLEAAVEWARPKSRPPWQQQHYGQALQLNADRPGYDEQSV